jgi:hypothetical protein
MKDKWHLKIFRDNGDSQNHHSNIYDLSYEEEQVHSRRVKFQILKDFQVQEICKLKRGQKRNRVK